MLQRQIKRVIKEATDPIINRVTYLDEREGDEDYIICLTRIDQARIMLQSIRDAIAPECAETDPRLAQLDVGMKWLKRERIWIAEWKLENEILQRTERLRYYADYRRRRIKQGDVYDSCPAFPY